MRDYFVRLKESLPSLGLPEGMIVIDKVRGRFMYTVENDDVNVARGFSLADKGDPEGSRYVE